MKRLVLLAALTAAIFVTHSVRTAAKDVLKDAPNVSLGMLSGNAVHIGDLRGKVVLVDFFASWCIPCRKSFPELEALHRQHESQGLVVVAVNVDEERKNADAFLEMFPHSMRIALDPKGTVAEAFGVSAMPTTKILDRSGHIRYTHKGYTEKALAKMQEQVVALLAEAE